MNGNQERFERKQSLWVLAAFGLLSATQACVSGEYDQSFGTNADAVVDEVSTTCPGPEYLCSCPTGCACVSGTKDVAPNTLAL